MKKVININFQGRVIPIEETAYELLKQYVESLRRYFANEEGKDEIINDIEGRIAELFSERLKNGATCITDADVNAIMASMGRPEDFEAQDADSTGTTTSSATSGGQYTGGQSGGQYRSARNVAGGRLSRNSDDKILGGVCSGLANYFGIDPVVVRIIFVLLFGALFWVYILLWLILPARSIQSDITKRLYRNPDDKVIAGVAGGLASYFNIEPWVPRLIFALPFVIALVSGTLDSFWWHGDFGFFPRMAFGSVGSTMFVTYIILWIVIPMANTAAEKLEMKGEKVNLNTIRDTVKEDLEGFKQKAQNFGSEVKATAANLGERAKEIGSTAGTHARQFAGEVTPVVKRTGSGLGYVIGILFKAFFLFVAGVIALALFGVLIGMVFGGFAIFPLKNFVLDGFWQNALAWTALILFLGIPVLGLITWLIRRIAGIRSRNNYLGYVFGGLWTIGLVALVFLAASVSRNFRTRSAVEEKITSVQPANGKMYVDVADNNVRYYGSDWYGIDHDEDWPFYGISPDTLMVNTVRVNVVRSSDSLYHIHRVRFGRGSNPGVAREIAEHINFEINQQDSLIELPKGFAISRDDKYRAQQVLVVIEVPMGKKIQLDHSLDYYDWFDVNTHRRGWNVEFNDDWERDYHWQTGVEYVMTPEGLRRTSELDEKELKNGRFRLKIDENGIDMEAEGEIDSQPRTNDRKEGVEINADSGKIRVSISETNTEAEGYDEDLNAGSADLSTPMIVFARLFQ